MEVIHPFIGDAISRAELGQMAADAYARFGHKAVTPLVQIAPDRWILELFHGPTLAFKDVAMQLLARLMDRVLAKRKRRATIVGATSGDTGGAAIEAFRGSERVDVVILFPEGRVSDVQRRMMTTPADANVHAVAVKGTFDDCQALVKGMFNDHAFRDRAALSGVNSINWARIAGQVTYYFAAAVALGARSGRSRSSVPTGNFGDIFAGYVAKAHGAADRATRHRVERQRHPAAHARDRRLRDARRRRDVVAVDGHPDLLQFRALPVRGIGPRRGPGPRQDAALGGTQRFELGPLKPPIPHDFAAAAASEDDVADAIRRLEAECGYLADPHTACALVAAERVLGSGGGTPQVVLATAHPAKFPDAMQAITGARPPLPERLAGSSRRASASRPLPTISPRSRPTSRS